MMPNTDMTLPPDYNSAPVTQQEITERRLSGLEVGMFPSTYIDNPAAHIDDPATPKKIIAYLPPEVGLNVLGNLNPQELNNAGLAAKYWSEITSDSQVWRGRVENKFDSKTISKAEAIDSAVLGEDDDTYQKHKVERAKNIYIICNLFKSYKLEESAIKDIFCAKKGGATKLDLNGKRVTSLGVEVIITALKDPECKVVNLDLSDNLIDSEGIKKVALFLNHKKCQIVDLNLMNNKIGVDGAKHLSIALMEPNHITNLNLGSNQMGVDGVRAVVGALLHKNCQVTKLSLWDNQMGDAGAEIVAAAIKKSDGKVVDWDLGDNQIMNDGARAIAEAVVSIKQSQNREIQIKGIDNFDKFLTQAEQNWR